MGGEIYRFEVPVDDRWHEIPGCGTPLHVGCRDTLIVEFWAWRQDGTKPLHLRVFGTGQPIPVDATHHGTVVAPGGRLVWHLIETA